MERADVEAREIARVEISDKAALDIVHRSLPLGQRGYARARPGDAEAIARSERRQLAGVVCDRRRLRRGVGRERALGRADHGRWLSRRGHCCHPARDIRELPRRSFTKRAIVSVERHRRQFTLAESHVGERLLLGARSSQGQSVGRLINPNDLPGRANQFGGQECNVAGSASDVENTHARGNPCFDQKLPRNRVDELPLT
jgi:hypothetical protein